MEFKRITLLMIYLSTSIAQEDSAKFQASLNDALPSIQAEMTSFHNAWKNFRLSPEQPYYYQQISNDMVIVNDMVKDLPGSHTVWA